MLIRPPASNTAPDAAMLRVAPLLPSARPNLLSNTRHTPPPRGPPPSTCRHLRDAPPRPGSQATPSMSDVHRVGDGARKGER